MTADSRCSACGGFATRDGALTRFCHDAHASAGLIPWPHPGGATSDRPLLSVAYHAVCQVRASGQDVPRWIETVPSGEHKGCTKDQLSQAFRLAQRWGWPELVAAKPVSLFGKAERYPGGMVGNVPAFNAANVAYVERTGGFHERGCDRSACRCWGGAK